MQAMKPILKIKIKNVLLLYIQYIHPYAAACDPMINYGIYIQIPTVSCLSINSSRVCQAHLRGGWLRLKEVQYKCFFFFLTCAVRMSTGYGGYPMSKLQVEYMYTITAHHITHHRWHGSGWHHSLQRPRPEALSPLNLLNSTRRPLQNIPYDLSSLTVPYSSRFGWARDARRAEICGCEAVWSDLL